MSQIITITIAGQDFSARLNDSAAARELIEALPLTVTMSRWGDEYYGGCTLNIEDIDSAREIMEVGEIAYWPPGSALCFFFGATPASTDERPRAASPVVPLGMITSETEPIKSFGSTIRAEIQVLQF